MARYISYLKFIGQSRRCNNRSDRKYFTQRVREAKSDKQWQCNFRRKISSPESRETIIFVFFTKYFVHILYILYICLIFRKCTTENIMKNIMLFQN